MHVSVIQPWRVTLVYVCVCAMLLFYDCLHCLAYAQRVLNEKKINVIL